MIEQTFKRKPTIGLITLAFAALFIYHGVSHTEYNFIPPIVKYISAGLAFIYAIWQFATPYVIITDSTITMKKDVFSTKSIDIKQINEINMYNDEIELKNGMNSIRIKLKILGSYDKEELTKKIKEMKDKEE